MDLHQMPASNPAFRELLNRLAKRYVWWQTPDVTLQFPRILVARTMNMGDYEDVQGLTRFLSDEELKRVIDEAEIGEFDERSWAYWHYRLGLPVSQPVPPMPRRRLG